MSKFYRKKYDDDWTIDDSKTLYDDLVQLSHKYKKSKDEMFEKIKTVLHNYNPYKHQYYNKNLFQKLYTTIEDIWFYRAELTNEIRDKISNNTR